MQMFRGPNSCLSSAHCFKCIGLASLMAHRPRQSATRHARNMDGKAESDQWAVLVVTDKKSAARIAIGLAKGMLCSCGAKTARRQSRFGVPGWNGTPSDCRRRE